MTRIPTSETPRKPIAQPGKKPAQPVHADADANDTEKTIPVNPMKLHISMSDLHIEKNWRNRLTVDELRTVEQAKAYTEFRAGTQTNSPLTLIDKLANILDGE